MISEKGKKWDASKAKPMDDPYAPDAASVLGEMYRIWREEGTDEARGMLTAEIKWVLAGIDELDLTIGVAEVMHFGAEKYGWKNWQLVDNAVERYLNAALRHHLHYVYYSGDIDGKDAESGLPHVWHAACSFVFALWFLR